MSCPYYRGSQVAEETGRGKTGSRYSEATALGGERQEKDSEQAMVEPPMGGIYEAQPAAEPGESVIFKTMNSATGGLGPDGVFGASVVVVEVLKPEFFAVAPEARSEGYQHPIPRLKKDKVKRGYAHHGKTENLGLEDCCGQDQLWTFVHISFPSEDPSDSDLDVV